MFPFFSTVSLILWTYFLRNNSMTLTNLSMFENHTILIYIKIHHIFDNLSPYLKTSNQTFLYIQIYKQNQLHLWLKKVKFPTKLLKAYSFSGNFIQLKFYIFIHISVELDKQKTIFLDVCQEVLYLTSWACHNNCFHYKTFNDWQTKKDYWYYSLNSYINIALKISLIMI